MKRRQRHVSERYKCLENFHRSFCFESTDQILGSLGLKLLMLDISLSPTAEDWGTKMRKELILRLQENDSLVMRGNPESPFVKDTIRGEHDILQILTPQQSCMTEAERAEYKQTVTDYIEASVVLGDQRRNVLCLLGFARDALRFQPLLGATISLTGVEGETEIKWGFSRLSFLDGYPPIPPPEARLLEGIFAFRIIMEGFFVEDLRLLRLQRNGFTRSDRTRRFVSIVSSDLMMFPESFVELYVSLEGFCRHYNIAGSTDLRHGPGCRCRKLAEAIVSRPIKADSESGGKRKHKKGCVGSAPTPCSATEIRPLAPGSIARTLPARRILHESVKESTTFEASISKVWSFYGISMFNFDRLLKSAYEHESVVKNDSLWLQVKSVICQQKASDTLMSYVGGSLWTQKN
eukprot:Blabericola_migrator_1__3045@NODE_1887_length_3605_cov_175_298191_g1209_i0_p2_GENE_NODE_1887_length_3605_cov_175_298191_g1209_i0NODE_1887_length_3605_cov_175_298191_g1209_i0_p2_ORF_typecomplete_len406_score37_22_NODE_1887_length_3605_cov_175_298191_g1209_i021103327